MVAIFYFSGKFLKAYLMALLHCLRLNLSTSIIYASLIKSSSSSSSLLMLRFFPLRSGVSFWSGDTHVIPSDEERISKTWSRVGGDGFL